MSHPNVRPDVHVKYDEVDGRLRAFAIDGNGHQLDDVEIAWAPMDGGQRVFLEMPGEVAKPDGTVDGIYEALACGNRGGGKTETLACTFGQYVGHGWGANWRGLIARQNADDFKDLIAKTEALLPEIWPELRGGETLSSGEKVGYNRNERCWVWKTGEKLYLRHLERPDQFRRYKGWELPFIGWEELTQWPTDELFLNMQSCSRSPVRGLPLMVRSTTNPDGIGHFWVKMRYSLPMLPGKVIGKMIRDPKSGALRVAVNIRLEDNIILAYSNPQYMNKLLEAATSEDQRKAWRDGDWNIMPSGMFNEVYREEHHVVESFEVPQSWRIERSFDWGASKPFSVGWWARSDGTDYKDARRKIRSSVRGDLFRIMEWYGWTGKPNVGLNLSDAEIARGIIEREVVTGLHGRVHPGPADCSIFKRENRPTSVADTMKQPVRIDGRSLPGPTFLHADQTPGSRVPGWRLVREYLEGAVPPERGVREKPGLFCFDTCDQYRRLIPSTKRDDKKRDDVDSESEDHLQDEVRYMVKGSPKAVSSGRTVGMY